MTMVATLTLDTVTPELVKDVVGRLFEAYAAHDPDKILTLFAEGFVWEESGLAEPLRTPEAAKAHLASLFRAMPDLHYTEVEYFVSIEGRKGLSHWRAVGKMTGPLDPPGYAPTNQNVEFEGVCVYEFSGGLISRHTVIFDMAGVGRQIGALPKEGSLSDKVGVRLQKLAVKNPLHRK